MLSHDNDLWVFDENNFKDAITFLLLQDKREINEDDLELKKLIAMQFEDDSDMNLWTIGLFNEVF